MHCENKLLDVVRALHTARRFTGRLNRRQKQTDEDADDGDDDEELDKGKTFALTADIGENCASAGTTITSGNTRVATVDSKGKITAVSAGRAVITVKTFNGKTATCVVTVTEPASDAVGAFKMQTVTTAE